MVGKETMRDYSFMYVRFMYNNRVVRIKVITSHRDLLMDIACGTNTDIH